MPTEVVGGRDLTKIYPSGVTAVDGVSLSLSAGTLTALVGPNGAGKSTLCGLLGGLMSPSSGEVTLLGLRQPSADARRLRRLQSKLAYVDQDPALDPEMTGGEILRLLSALYAVKGASDELAERFGIAPLLGRRVASWSGGQKRRLHLASALLHSPEVLFLDEPTAGLDGDGARRLYAELDRRVQAGATVVLVGHDLDEVEREAGHVVMLDRGRVVASGSPAELIAEHGASWLRVTLRAAPSADESSRWVHALESLPGFSQPSCEGRRLWVRTDDFSPERIGELVAALATPIADVVVHRQDLASVYRTLTGRDPAGERREQRRERRA